MEERINYFRDEIRDFKDQEVQKKGVQLNDRIFLYLFEDRDKKMDLNRTSFIFHLKKNFRFKKENNCIFIPSTYGKESVYELFLDDTPKESERRYLFKSSSGVPFKINGNLCYEAHVMKQDRIQMGFNEIIFRDDQMDSCDDMPALDFITSDISILLQGETGTGKSELAKKIHKKSKRSGRFVHINPSSFVEGLVESELFGHCKGAFTGAIQAKKGAILEADRGTLFIDEIDSLPISMQIKLLLFLDSKRIREVGGNMDRKVDTRLIFASGKNLFDLTKINKIRSDFYYRISSGITFDLPSLRHNKNKIKEICHNYFEQEKISVTTNLMNFYLEYNWPGNIRQLTSHLKKKRLSLKKNKWDFDNLDEKLIIEKLPIPCEKYMSLEKLKRDYAYKIFLNCDRNIKYAAGVLKILPQTLDSMIKRRKLSLLDN